ncbi:branched-chain amino acid aminotransferase [Corynebacterium gottingense]|uniref:branched-chain amino acid aminotransferase n=1 Tax=Corynebacterium TaxID=1716 RepID=UPI000BAA4CCA|nr:branched-chain amino acid aminotransferase [Corynebacterium hadale]MCG7254561.1 branched-chain amino acid aminotransferase [Corynebacterium hadale]MCG7256188.1 branched-chain amino acid aminotransferase [Corynebacterium hadale]MCG7264960.1 branched-chain amino acid aminotransferase [Corynebacterium hadale]PAT13512.1 branched chain amino acid aminotransferase [Corynebacterium hadale]
MTTLDFSISQHPNPATDAEREAILADPAFGQEFTDHMVSIEWTEDKGWHDAQVRPYGPVSLDPATNVFHYGQAIFEGLKAYRHADGSISTFRPEQNAKRMQHSAHRLAMPELPEELFIESLRQLVSIDKAWVPEAGGEAALYLRPFMIGTEKTLGVKPSHSYMFYVIASPAGAYFSGGVKPVSVWVSKEYVRAAPGGTGDAKFAGNYAGSLLAQAEAQEKGCDQVVWLDAIERKYIEEMGGMNLMFVEGSGDDATLVTPALSGSLLAGITRKSLLQVAEDAGLGTEERKITVEQWREGVENGTITETLACGTAAVLTPVGRVRSADGEFTINNNEAGPITMSLRERLRGIQNGSVEDTHGWNVTLVEA